jgi:L-ascorbate metabolism protein UlaG (beta-lactamase superfamily)
MSNTCYRFAKSTVIEPLINQWAVWSDLISPVPYSMHMTRYQIPTLTSYLKNPDVHRRASQDPKLIGGPFVNIPKERRAEVEALVEETKGGQKEYAELAESVVSFYDLLDAEAKGQSLDPYYSRVPEALKGYVELLYDYYNHPIVRVLEPLLYRRYATDRFQSLRLFQPARDESRRFFLNTPHLIDEGEVDWKVRFADSSVDELLSLDSQPEPLSKIGDLMGVNGTGLERLLPLLAEAPAVALTRPWNGAVPRIRYFGHACVVVEWKGVTIMTDPWVGVMPRQGGMERFSYDDLPEHIDFALITHGHHDHFVCETLLRLRNRLGVLVVPKSFGLYFADVSLKLAAESIGFKNVIELDSMASLPLPDGEIVAIPFFGEHADLPHAKSGYVVRCGQEKILFAADSNCIEPQVYENVRKAIGNIQTVFLGMECVGAPLSWLYGALLPSKLNHAHDKTRRTKGSDSTAAMALLKAVNGLRVYIYALGSEPWLNYSMGLGLSAGSPQLLEATKVLSAAQEMGLLDAQRPFGSLEIRL